MSRSGRINLHNVLESDGAKAPKMSDNYLMKFRNKNDRKLNKFTAAQFLDVWNHFDEDGNGYIEASELDEFLIQFVTSVLPNEPIGSEVLSQAAYQAMKNEFMQAYDENEDGRIEIGELSQILPTDEEFLVLFQRENPLSSSVEFLKTWKTFDKDCSGFIESNELQDFISDLLLKCGKRDIVDDAKLVDYTNIMLKLFDRNGDGKLQLSEMARLLPMKENYLSKPLFNNSTKLSYMDLDRIFKLYDEDCDGLMDEREMQALLVDLLELSGEHYDQDRVAKLQKIILSEWDVNYDGKINKKELKMILTQHSKLGEVTTQPYSRINLNDTVMNSI